LPAAACALRADRRSGQAPPVAAGSVP